MSFGQKRSPLVRGVARTVERVEGLGRAFRIVVRKETEGDHVTVEAETLEPASDEQIQALSAKLLDALTLEMTDVLRESEDERPLTLKVVQPGTLPRSRLTGRVKPLVAFGKRVD
jgi:hypothetical protein